MSSKVTYTHEADFRRERDFGAKVSATFEFVAAQFKPLVKCLTYFVLPGALLAGIGLGLFANNFMSLMGLAMKPGGAAGNMSPDYVRATLFSGSSFVGMGLAVLGFLAAFLLLASTVYGFVQVRMRTPAAEVVQPAQVWRYVGPRLGRVLLAWLLLGGVVGLGLALLGGVLSLLGPGFVVLLFPLLMWLSVCLTLYFPALWMEDAGVLTALRRSFYLIKGKWWSSLGLYMVMSFITGLVNYIFIIPFYGLMMARMLLKTPGLDSEVLSVATMSIYALGWVFTATLPLLAMAFQYFNLVERKEGVGLRLLVDSLGRGAAPQVRNATFQPDEDGEY